MSMRERLCAIVFVFAGLCGAAAADERPRKVAQVAEEARRVELVGRLFDLGSSRGHVVNWQRMLAAQAIEAADSGATSELRDRLRRAWTEAVAGSFDVDALMGAWQQRLAADVSLADLEQQIVFETSAVGQHLNAISRHAAASQPDASESARRLVEGKRLVERHPARARLLGRILAALDMKAVTVEVLCSLQLATLAGVIDATPEGSPRADMGDLGALVGQCRAAMNAQLADTLMPSYAAMWSTLSLAELEAYARHVEEPATRRVVRASSAIYGDLMRRSAVAVGRSFVREFHAVRL